MPWSQTEIHRAEKNLNGGETREESIYSTHTQHERTDDARLHRMTPAVSSHLRLERSTSGPDRKEHAASMTENAMPVSMPY